jgi:hypothetical protein
VSAALASRITRRVMELNRAHFNSEVKKVRIFNSKTK